MSLRRITEEQGHTSHIRICLGETGKRWFYPSQVQALEFPYGFATSTRNKYATALDLLNEICERTDEIDFDIALIAAAGMGIPIATHIKRRGKVALSLGGHLQVLFGVIGKRWRDRESWKQNYFNEAWIDMPDNYKPKEIASGKFCDAGAYW